MEVFRDWNPSTARPAVECAHCLDAVGRPLVFSEDGEGRCLREEIETAAGFDFVPVNVEPCAEIGNGSLLGCKLAIALDDVLTIFCDCLAVCTIVGKGWILLPA